MNPDAVPGVAALVASFALSACVTWLAIRYAHWRGMIDEPGRRRSHREPTPRGGGIGIVVAVLAIFVAEMFWLPGEALPDLAACSAAIVLVAAVGWIDDHGGLAARWRLLAQFAAATLVLIALAHEPAASTLRLGVAAQAVICLLLVLGVAWSINLHNFMDGIDGILALQAIFVFVAFAWLCARAGADADAWHLAALAAAVAGFLPFNFPRARIFMGDVGSGVLGLLIAIALLRLLAVDGLEPASGVVAASAFVVDASCNLVSRMWRGRRWYSAHREHLYQWMVRAGMSHARVVAWYMAWNVVLVAPLLLWMNRQPASAAGVLQPRPQLAAAGAVYAFGALAWIFGKRWCLDKVKTRAHATA